MYGLSKNQVKYAKKKVQDTKFYLDNNFIEVDNKMLPLSAFYKNPIVNADRYVAEIQHRVWSLYNYAKHRDLVNVFVTLTLPSEYHPKKTIKFKSGGSKLVDNPNFINDDEHDPKSGSLELSKMLKKIFDDRAYKSIPKEDRVYFRVTEPHKDGTPHLHISFFVPSESVDKFVESIKRKFPEPQSKIELNVNDPVKYLMKYILKTLDDMRYGEEAYTDLSLWYIYWGIARFYTSRTLISLDVYRVLQGQYTLNELSVMYKDKTLTVFLAGEHNKVFQIFDDGICIYQRKTVHIPNKYSVMGKLSLPEKKKPPVPVFIDGVNSHFFDDGEFKYINRPISKMHDYELYQHYRDIEHDYEVEPQHFALVKNALIERNYLDEEKVSANDFVFDDIFEFRDDELYLKKRGCYEYFE